MATKPTILNPMTLKRLNKELEILNKDPSAYFDAKPDEDNMLVWYFLLRGAEKSDYVNGWYLGKITHDPEYPMKPSNFQMLTPSGRYAINTNICLSFTSYHKEEWSPLWNIASLIDGISSNMCDDKQIEHGLGSLKNTPQQRAEFANDSIAYNLQNHEKIFTSFTRFIDADGMPKSNEEILLSSKPKKKKKTADTEQVESVEPGASKQETILSNPNVKSNKTAT